MQNVRAFLLVAFAATSVTGSSACATSSARPGTVSGIFDEPSPDRDGDGIPDQVDRLDTTEAEESKTAGDVGGRSTGGLFGKASPARGAPPPPPPAPETTATPPPDKPEEAKPEPPKPDGQQEPKEPEASGPRLVIYKGTVSVLVPAVDAAVEKLTARAKELGGYVETQTANTSANNATVSVRIPAEKFYDVVNELGSYGQVTEKQINAEDVTKRVFDVELRLDTAEKSRARLLDLLKTATKTEDVLQIENEIRRLTDEIEGMKGELRFLKDQVAMSTLAVSFWSNAPPPTSARARVRSRFEWINRVGVESVLAGF